MRTKRSSKRTRTDSQVERPYYDSARRKLWWGGKLVKEFAQRASNQHLILCAFEEQGWPPRIDDPLPPRGHGTDPKRRLNRAINRLNDHQLNRRIRFRGDGTGEGILWEPRRR